MTQGCNTCQGPRKCEAICVRSTVVDQTIAQREQFAVGNVSMNQPSEAPGAVSTNGHSLKHTTRNVKARPKPK